MAITAICGCWILLFNEIRGEWQVNAQYNYGYVVPLLGLALFWRRWPERPVGVRGNSVLAVVVGAACLFLLLPLRIIVEANPEWRLVYWVHVSLVLGMTFSLLYSAGGWTWTRFFAAPLLFMLIAVPWPMAFEEALIQHLMRVVAALTVEVVGWFGIPALQFGNLIQVGAGTVGIDEACSGVRSLQSGLMLSLFLGEMHRFVPWRRTALVGLSFLVVLAANVSRTTFLTYVAATRGLRQMEAWHDPAGLLVMCMVLAGLVALASAMRPKASRARLAQAAAPLPQWAMPRWIGVTIIVWLALAELSTEGWYRSRERDLVNNPHWTVAWPSQCPDFRKAAVPEKSLAILRCTQSQAASWDDLQGNRWSAFLLRWPPGRNSAQLAKGHRPDICFPAAGAKLIDDEGTVTFNVHGMLLPFRHETFESGPRLLHVLYCLWPDRVSRHESRLVEDGSQRSRLLAALAGKRNLGQQVFELVVSGPSDNEAALRAVETELPQLIQRE